MKLEFDIADYPCEFDLARTALALAIAHKIQPELILCALASEIAKLKEDRQKYGLLVDLSPYTRKACAFIGQEILLHAAESAGRYTPEGERKTGKKPIED